MTNNDFRISGTDSKKLNNIVRKQYSKFFDKHKNDIKRIQNYKPSIEEQKNKSTQPLDHLKPVKSHRRGIMGHFANIVLGKLFLAVQTFLTPVFTRQNEINTDRSNDIDKLIADLGNVKQSTSEANNKIEKELNDVKEEISVLEKTINKSLIQQKKIALKQQDILSGLKENTSTITKQLKSLNSKQESQDKELESQNKELEFLNSKQESQDDELKSLNSKQESQDKELESQNKELEFLNSKQESQNKELEFLNSKQESQDKELEFQNKELEFLNSKQESQDKELESTKNLNNELKKDISIKYKSAYKAISFLQRYIGEHETEMDYEKLYQREYFEGGSYDNYLNTSGIFEEFSKMLEKNFKPKCALDIGCAYGFIPQFYREKKNIESYGIDISKHAVKKLGLDYIKHGNILDIDNVFGEKKFDLILSLETLEHLIQADITKALEQIEKHASKYVLLLISTSEVMLDSIDAAHFSLLSRREWNNIFSKIGWLKKLDSKKTKHFNEHPFSKKMNWENRFWIFNLK